MRVLFFIFKYNRLQTVTGCRYWGFSSWKSGGSGFARPRGGVWGGTPHV